MAETIRVTVEVPELSEAQIEALRGLLSVRPDRTPFYCLLASKKFEMQESGLIQSVVCPGVTPLGRAVLEHYEAQR